MSVLAHEQRSRSALISSVFADGLCDGQDMGLGKGRIRTSTSMTARTETDELICVSHIGFAFVKRGFYPAHVDEKVFRGWLTCKGVYAHGVTGVGVDDVWATQISFVGWSP